MGVIRNIVRKIGNVFKKKPSSKVAAQSKISAARQRMISTQSFGHHGIAAGSLEPGKIDLSDENLAKRRLLSEDEAIGFLAGDPLFVHSTNVLMAQYYPVDEKLMIEFRGGGAYLYSNVSEEEAIRFLNQGSKGGFVWDVLRVRGSKKAHRKPYVKLR